MMRRHFAGFLAVLTIAIGTILIAANVSSAKSLLPLSLGGDFGYAKQSLIAKGYSQIELVGQGFSKFQVEACKGGVRYWFKSDMQGNTNERRKIGSCRATFNMQQAKLILNGEGYERVNIEDRGGRYLAVACLRGERVRVNVSYTGQVGRRQVIGSCRKNLNPSDVAVKLQNEGYTHIKFINRQAPVYVVDACLGKRKFRLDVDEYANTVSQKPLGKCRGPISSRQLTRFLEDKGYTRILIIDDQLPRYVAEVCQGRSRFELTMNRYGDVIQRYDAGNCNQRIGQTELLDQLRAQGFFNFAVKWATKKGFLIAACHSNNRYEMKFNSYGEFQKEKNLGPCTKLNLDETYTKLEKQKFRKIKFYVQACLRGKLLQFRLNTYGERTERKVLGRCK